MKTLTLRKNFYWTFTGNIVYAASQWAMLIVMAKIGNPEMVGRFALALAITAPAIMLTNLQTRAVQVTDAKKQFEFGNYLALRLITTFLFLVIMILVVWLGGYKEELGVVILIVAISKVIEAVSDIFYGLFQQHERMDKIARSMMLKGPLALVALSVGIYYSGSLIWGTVGLVLIWFGVLCFYDIPCGIMVLRTDDSGSIPIQLTPLKKILARSVWEPRTLTRLAYISVPLGIVMMLVSLNTNIPRYFIEHHLGQRELGIFAAMAYLMVAGGQVVNALGQASSPRLAKYYAKNDIRKFLRLLIKLLIIGGAIGGTGVIASVFFGREILTLVYSAEYAEQLDVFIMLMTAAGIGYVASFLGYGMTAARHFRSQAPLFLLITSATGISCFFLVPSYGLKGAAVSLLFSTFIQFFGSGVINIYAIKSCARSCSMD